MISRLRQADHAILILNLLLLMSIGVLPFATSLMSTYLKESHGQHLAAVIYSGSLLMMSILFATLNRHILLRKAHFIGADLPLERRRTILKLAICAAVALFYALPVASGGQQ